MIMQRKCVLTKMDSFKIEYGISLNNQNGQLLERERAKTLLFFPKTLRLTRRLHLVRHRHGYVTLGFSVKA